MGDPFTSFDRVASVLGQVLDSSVADETEIVWFERRYGDASVGERAGELRFGTKAGAEGRLGDEPLLTILIRVVQGGRLGWHRTHVDDPNELESGVRQALAVATVQEPAALRPVLPRGRRRRSPDRGEGTFFDPAIAELEPAAARALLERTIDEVGRGSDGADDETTALHATLHWSATRVAIANSHGLRRRARTTEVSLEACCGARADDQRGAGDGYAAASARSLAALDVPEILRRARRRACEAEEREPARIEGSLEPLPDEPLPDEPLPAGPIVLAPEAVAMLLDVLNTFAFAGRTYLDGSSFLSRHRNVQVFDRSLRLVDDATRRPGLPFPFDLEGSMKRPVELIVEGRPSTPALDALQGARAGMQSTAGSVGGADALFGNLFLEPGDATIDELIALADGGLWIGWLDPLECHEPRKLAFRAVARGVRRIEDGRLGAPIVDLDWEESLLAALARLRAVGAETTTRSLSSTPLGAITTPALVLESAGGLRPRGQ